jgi:hypothetical protein
LHEQSVHAIQGGASDDPERIEMKYMAVNATPQDIPAEIGPIEHRKSVESDNSKNKKAPPNLAGATGSGKGVGGSSDTKEIDPNAGVSSTAAMHDSSQAEQRHSLSWRPSGEAQRPGLRRRTSFF